MTPTIAIKMSMPTRALLGMGIRQHGWKYNLIFYPWWIAGIDNRVFFFSDGHEYDHVAILAVHGFKLAGLTLPTMEAIVLDRSKVVSNI